VSRETSWTAAVLCRFRLWLLVAGSSGLCLHWPVAKFRKVFLNWLPVLVWMAVIFSASSDSGSFQHSSRIIAPVVRWLFPHISDQRLHNVVLGVRKVAHLTEYAILAVLVWRSLNNPTSCESGRLASVLWNWRRAGWALAIAALYAASDEFHQRFVPTREASVLDVIIDTCGAAAGLLALRFVVGLRPTTGKDDAT